MAAEVCFECIKVDGWIPRVCGTNKRVPILKFQSPTNELRKVVIFYGSPLVVYTPGSIRFVPGVCKASKQDTPWTGDLEILKNQQLQIEEVTMIGAFQMHGTALIQKSP